MARTWTTPTTWGSGQTPGSTDLNREVRDNQSFLAQPSYVSAYRTSDQTGIAAATETAVTWQAVEEDLDGMWSALTPTRLTVVTGWAGLWQWDGAAVWQGGASSTSQRIRAILRVNGTTDIVERTNSAKGSDGTHSVPVNRTYRMVVGDYIEMFVWANSDFDELNSGIDQTLLQGRWVGL